MESYSSDFDEEPVDVGPLQVMVEAQRNRTATLCTRKDDCDDDGDDDRSLLQLESDSSDYNFTQDDFNSSDSEWDKDEEKRLTKKVPGSDSCDSDDEIPLSKLIKGHAKPKTVAKSVGVVDSVQDETIDVDLDAFHHLNVPDCAEEPNTIEDDCRAVLSLIVNMVECEINSERREGSAFIMRNFLEEIEPTDSMPSQSVEESDETSFCSVTEMEADSVIEMATPSPRGRKRKRNVDAWSKTRRKEAVNQGKEFVDKSGNITVRKRCMKQGCRPKCRQKCHDKLNEGKRLDAFHTFWQLPTIVEKRFFLSHFVNKIEKKTGSAKDSKRKATLCWTLPEDEGKELPVCNTFFLHTLGISEQMVKTALLKMDTEGFSQTDKRGCGTGSRNEEERAAVRAHIQSFPVVESHFCRKTSERKYLGAHLNVSMMHRLYCQERSRKDKRPYSIRSYRDIFNQEYNLGFHRPSKDLCDKCCSYRLSSVDEKLSLKAEMEQHLSDHLKIRLQKDAHKDRSKRDTSFETYVFDMEEVLPTPKVNCSMWYYKRKLSTYNLSWYELGSSDATCNVWNESTAGRGSNEIASCLYTALEDAASRGVKDVALYSDSCGGQNKNRNFVCMMWLAVNRFAINSIEQLFFIRGHSKNENDSVHSAIERASNPINVFTTGQWAAIMRSARHKDPYDVREMCVNDFLDFKKVAGSIANFDLDTDKNAVRWLDIKKSK